MRIARVILFAMLPGPAAVGAQTSPVPAKDTVLFLCEHGTVKSLLAKLLFDQYAEEVGLDMIAVSRGARADTAVPPWMMRSLATDRLAIGSWRPRTVQNTDVANASLIISFDVPFSATAAQSPPAAWDGLPSVSSDYASGRDAIRARVRQLVDSLKRARSRP